MKILFVTLYSIQANNSGMIRNRALIKGLLDIGNEVSVLTVKQNRLQESLKIDLDGLKHIFYAGENRLYDMVTNQGNLQKNRTKIKHKIENVLRKVYHRWYPYDYTMNIAKKIDLSILEGGEYDLIISSSNPVSSHKAVDCLIKQGLKYKKWIQYWGDPLSANISNTTLLPDFILRGLEKELFSSADRIIFVSPLTYDYECECHKKYKTKFEWLPIPYESKQYYTGDKYISYFGDYVSTTRNILPLYEAVKDLQVDTIIAGTSDLVLNETGKIKVLKRCDVSEYMNQTRVSVLLLNKQGTQIPGKIYHIAGTNIKALVICDGDYGDRIKEYFAKYNRFVFCENDKLSITEALQKLMNDKEQQSPVDDFSNITIAKKFMNL